MEDGGEVEQIRIANILFFFIYKQERGRTGKALRSEGGTRARDTLHCVAIKYSGGVNGKPKRPAARNKIDYY